MIDDLKVPKVEPMIHRGSWILALVTSLTPPSLDTTCKPFDQSNYRWGKKIEAIYVVKSKATPEFWREEAEKYDFKTPPKSKKVREENCRDLCD